ncbi:hypothetical protein CIB95_00200 [Lottiidibacillus patelloidae]|uniref:GH16 domain-containing protein n=1 Tax=Lottiidibacillus patelloidae TaxID=2670334 RepID=A0A263BXZ7_9BACI|nr:hypothetical protein [Lottiidibacillus patelloidae]OZM58036.1 hypothetical protein CIB95_00200 [Lottiidibacillus patelloidae]
METKHNNKDIIYNLQESSLDSHGKIKKTKKFLITLLFITVIIALLSSYYSYSKYLSAITPNETYYSTEFEELSLNWTSFDATHLEDYHGQNGVVKLARNEYFSPNMMTTEGLNSIQSDTFVYHFKARLHSFTQSSVTLSTLYFPTGPITIVANKDHQLGIATDFSAEPIYSSSEEIKKDTWEDIYVYVDGLGNEVSLYLNNNKLMTIPYKGETYPLQELWFGSIWVGGAGGYGIPTDIAFDSIQIGNEALLPQPSYINFLVSTFTN